MDYAIVEVAGKQYKAIAGKTLKVDRLTDDVGAEVAIPNVLLVANGEDIQVGAPLVAGVTLTAKVTNHFQGKKVRVLRFRAKSHYHKVTGHRHQYTELLIQPFGAAKKAEKATKADKATAEA